MDPPTTALVNRHPTTTPFNLSEIWPIPINGGGGELAGAPAHLRRGSFGSNLGRFMEPGPGPGPSLEVSGSGDGAAGGGARKRRESGASAVVDDDDDDDDDDSAKGVCNGMSECDGKRLKRSGSGDENQNPKADGEASSGKGEGKKSKSPPEPPKDYIHVRARRGQATDSHSLAERARREKISERMRILQDLVPGCNKVIGKALVLDEIINYIQSLQRQVEFLSMKLEAVNSRSLPGIEGFPTKDFGQQAFDPSGVVYGSHTPREYNRGSSPEWLHMQVGGGFERQTS